MCRELVSCADFKAILTPFSGVILKPLLLLLNLVPLMSDEDKTFSGSFVLDLRI